MQQFFDRVVANPWGFYGILSIAAALEVFADSWFNSGLHRSSGSARLLSVAAGILLLAAYGLLLNIPRWNFGKLIGIYVALFFVVAQIVARLRFHETPTRPILLGGLLILSGGLIITFWRA